MDQNLENDPEIVLEQNTVKSEREDAEANARGEITASQRKRIEGALKGERRLRRFLKWFTLGCTLATGGVVWWLVGYYPDATCFALCAGPFATVALFCLMLARKRQPLPEQYLADLAGGRVEVTEGQTKWKWFNYRLETPHPLQVPHNVRLWVGHYRFYYLPHSNEVVQVDSIGTSPDLQALIQEALMCVLHFDNADLDINRQGKMSVRQKRRLQLELCAAVGLFVICYGLLPGFLVYLSATQGLVLPTPNLGIGRAMAEICIGVSLVFFFPIGAWLLIFKAYTQSKGTVNCIEGYGFMDGERGGWKINHLPFRVRRHNRRALVEGLRYRAYYLARTQQLLSIEPLASDIDGREQSDTRSPLSHAEIYELDMNRADRLTAAQQEALRRYWLRLVAPIVTGIILGLALLGLVLPAFDLFVPFPLWVVSFFVILYGYVWLRKLNWFALGLDLLFARVTSREGVLRRVANLQKLDLYLLGENPLVLPRVFRDDERLKLITGERYRIFTLPRSGMAVNFERLEGEITLNEKDKAKTD